jgi:hypothetical protein
VESDDTETWFGMSMSMRMRMRMRKEDRNLDIAARVE